MDERIVRINTAAQFISSKIEGKKPLVGIVLGSGLGKLADKIQNPTVIPYSEIPGFPVVLANELKHCIVAHHGELEYGSPKKPALMEAMALNLADNTDARMETMTEIFDRSEDNLEWLGFNRIFESNIRRTSK